MEIVAFTSEVGTTRAITLSDDFVPTSGLAGLRVVDVAPGLGSLDVYVTPPGAPLGIPSTASIGFGGTTGFFDANPGTSQVRFTVATTPTLVLDAEILEQARADGEALERADRSTAAAQLEARRTAAINMEKADARIGEDDRVDGDWFDAVNNVAGLR